MKADLVLSLVMDKERDCVVPPVPPSFFKQLEKRGVMVVCMERVSA